MIRVLKRSSCSRAAMRPSEAWSPLSSLHSEKHVLPPDSYCLIYKYLKVRHIGPPLRPGRRHRLHNLDIHYM